MLSKLESSWEAFRKECATYVEITCWPEEDVRKLGRRGPEFDVAIAHWIFHVIEDWRLAVYAIDQAIRPTGRLLLATERSTLYSAIDGDLRDFTNGEDHVAREFWQAFVVERAKYDRESARRRLGSRVIDDRIGALLSALGWSEASPVLSTTWETRQKIAWLIDKVIEPRCFTNMQLFEDQEGADAEFKQIAGRLRAQFSRNLAHEWVFRTSFQIESVKRKGNAKLGSAILVDVARATVGRRWERGIGRTKVVRPIWDRLVASTWIRLNGGNPAKLTPLAGTLSKVGKHILGAYVAAPTTVDLLDSERVVTGEHANADLWSHAEAIWDALTSEMEMREPFVICIGHSDVEVLRILREWKSASRVHPPLHVIHLGAEAADAIRDIANNCPQKAEIEEHFKTACTRTTRRTRWCADLLFSASTVGVLPYDHERVAARFLAGLARLLAGDIRLSYAFPAAGVGRSRPPRGFFLATRQPLDGETARLFWSLGEVLFSEYEEAILPDQHSPVPDAGATPAPPPTSPVLTTAPRSKDAIRKEAIDLLSSLPQIDLSKHVVVGNYVRYTPATVDRLSSIVLRITAAFNGPTTDRENHLLWAPSGHGKTYLIEEIVRTTGVRHISIDLKLPAITEGSLRAELSKCEKGPEPLLCLIDEIHTRSSDPWPYEVIYGYLDINLTKTGADGNKVFVLLGSTPGGLQALVEEISSRNKGEDLLNRIPIRNEIPPLTLGDRLVIVASQLKCLAAAQRRPFQAVHKLAVLYILTELQNYSARQLTDFIRPALNRLPTGSTRLKLQDFFGHEDEDTKVAFLLKEQATIAELDNFLYIGD
jgi:hypothetical protein